MKITVPVEVGEFRVECNFGSLVDLYVPEVAKTDGYASLDKQEVEDLIAALKFVNDRLEY